MRTIKRHSINITKILTGVFLTILLCVHAYPYWNVNYSDSGFSGDSETLNHYIARGAGYFLDSYAHTLLFMQETEVSPYDGMNYPELQLLMKRAAESMRLANETYTSLKQAAEQAPYNPAVIDALKSYDYAGFMEKTGINDDVFADVRTYLGKGDIRSLYGRIVEDTGNIMGLISRVKTSVDNNKFPGLQDVWNLNRTFSRSLALGEYAARIFHDIADS